MRSFSGVAGWAWGKAHSFDDYVQLSIILGNNIHDHHRHHGHVEAQASSTTSPADESEPMQFSCTSLPTEERQQWYQGSRLCLSCRGPQHSIQDCQVHLHRHNDDDSIKVRQNVSSGNYLNQNNSFWSVGGGVPAKALLDSRAVGNCKDYAPCLPCLRSPPAVTGSQLVCQGGQVQISPKVTDS